MARSRLDTVHDVSLAAWAVLSGARAAGRHRPGAVDILVVGLNLAAGAPAALSRVRERRRDPVAVLAPVAVGGAVVATARPGPRFAPLVPVAVLVGLVVAERAGWGRPGGGG